MTRLAAAAAPGAPSFAACFAAGAVMGPLSVLLLEPHLGMAVAVALEAPLILAVAALSARAVLRRWPEASPCDPPRLPAEGLGFALQLAFVPMPALLARRA